MPFVTREEYEKHRGQPARAPGTAVVERDPQEEQEDPGTGVGPGTAAVGAIGERMIDNAGGMLEFLMQNHPKLGALPGSQRAGEIIPSGRDVMSGVDALTRGTSPGQAATRREAIAEENPIGTLVGTLGGDVVSLMSGRGPRTSAGGVFDEVIQRGAERFSTRLAPASTRFGSIKQVRDVIDSELFRKLARGLGRTSETGIEGYALGVMQNQDPIETAAFSAGAQAVSSGALALAEAGVEIPFRFFGSPRISKGTKVLAGLATQALLLKQMFAIFQQNPDAAEEDAYDKLSFGLLAGLAFGIGLGGKRPKPGGLGENFPTIADAILTAPRAAMINLVQELIDGDPEDTAPSRQVLTILTEAPEAFTSDQVSKLSRSIEDGTFTSTVDKLMEQEDFRKILEVPARFAAIPVEGTRRSRSAGSRRRRRRAARRRAREEQQQ